jgi:benzoyl-CoA 2,3-dioxygenase component B
MSVGDTGVGRIVERTAQIMREGKEDVRREGAIDLPTIQKYLNFWFSISLDLFGGEVSTNAAQFFAAGLKGRYKEQSYSDHKALDAVYEMDRIENGRPTRSEVPLRNAMNEVLRDAYVEDCQKGVDRWNRILEQHGLSDRFSLPHRRFNRQIGAFAGYPFDPGGDLLSEEQWKARRDEWLPSANDQAYVATLMKPVYEVGKIANWIAPPQSGVKGKPFAFEYVRKHE